MQAKHFLPDSDTLLSSSLYANTLLNPSVALDPVSKTIYRRPNYPAQVELLTGGGSGHEPAFTGYVGAGILSATVAGTIFASPSAKQVQGALSLLNSEDSKRKGTLVIVMNYTGDVLNFGLGVEKARAKGDKVDFVIVGDDCGVGRKAGGKVGRRGIAGTVLVVKIAGALAQAGADLETCKRVAELVQSNVLSVGASLEHVHVPGREKVQETSLAEGVVEVGMGIHNEEGAEKVKMNLQQLVERMLGMMLDKKDTDRAFLDWSPQDEWVLMINNLGGVSGLEMGGLVAEVSRQLQEPWRIKPKRTLSGTYITSLNGNGFSISLLRLQDTELGAKMSMLDLIEAPAETMGWTNPVQRETWERNDSEIVRKRKDTGQEETEPSNAKINVDLAKTALITGLEHAIAAEAEITKYDTIVGDGDCGIGLKRGAEAVLTLISDNRLSEDAVITVSRVATVIGEDMDGTSGALYAIYLNALAFSLRKVTQEKKSQMTAEKWAEALQIASESLKTYTPARPGDRTLIDALYPFVKVLGTSGSVKTAAKAAMEGADRTKGMRASLGRTVYVGGEGWQNVPDPGAFGLSVFLDGLASAL